MFDKISLSLVDSTLPLILPTDAPSVGSSVGVLFSPVLVAVFLLIESSILELPVRSPFIASCSSSSMSTIRSAVSYTHLTLPTILCV